jgi:hypothetical protein
VKKIKFYLKNALVFVFSFGNKFEYKLLILKKWDIQKNIEAEEKLAQK